MNKSSFSKAAVGGIFYKPSHLGQKGRVSSNGVPFACAFLSTSIGMTSMSRPPQKVKKGNACWSKRRIFID